MKPLAHWLGKFGFRVCKCKNCKRPRNVRNALAPKKSARQQAKREIQKELGE